MLWALLISLEWKWNCCNIYDPERGPPVSLAWSMVKTLSINKVLLTAKLQSSKIFILCKQFSLYSHFLLEIIFKYLEKKNLTVYAVKTKSLKVLILGMYMSASVRVNLKVSDTISKFRWNICEYIFYSREYDSDWKVYFFTEVTFIGIWCFLNFEYELPQVYSDVTDITYWPLPLIPCLQAHKSALISTIVIGTCNCAWCLEICTWSCICNITHLQKEISFAIKVINLSKGKKTLSPECFHMG